MAKGLTGVIRLHKWQVDEKRRQIADLEGMREDLVGQIKKLELDLSKEQMLMTDTNVVDFNYAEYAASVMQRRENIEASIAEVDVSIEEMKDELADAFKELKKFEIAQERAEEREREKQKLKEQDRLDEISLNMFRSGNEK